MTRYHKKEDRSKKSESRRQKRCDSLHLKKEGVTTISGGQRLTENGKYEKYEIF